MRKVTEDQIGVCQACLGEYKVNPATKKIVLHGYTRPGHGYVVGNCPGTDHVPFEYSCELTKQIVANLRKDVADTAAFLEKLQAGKVATLRHTWNTYHWEGRNQVKTVHDEEIAPGHELWEKAVTLTIANAKNDISFVTRLADHFQTAIDGWKLSVIVGIDVPATGKAKTLRPAYNPDEADAQAQRAAEKAARDAKPGKLKLVIYRAEPARIRTTDDDEWRKWYDAEKARKTAWTNTLKTWAKATFPAGKVIVQGDLSDYDLPRAVRSTGDKESVAVSIDWSYRDQLPEMFGAAIRVEDGKKKIAFYVEEDARHPWMA